MLVPGLLTMLHVVSVVENVFPDTATAVPAGPELGLSVIAGAGTVTVKVAWAESPELPVSTTVFAPGVAPPATVNDAELMSPFGSFRMLHEGGGEPEIKPGALLPNEPELQ